MALAMRSLRGVTFLMGADDVVGVVGTMIEIEGIGEKGNVQIEEIGRGVIVIVEERERVVGNTSTSNTFHLAIR